MLSAGGPGLLLSPPVIFSAYKHHRTDLQEFVDTTYSTPSQRKKVYRFKVQDKMHSGTA